MELELDDCTGGVFGGVLDDGTEYYFTFSQESDEDESAIELCGDGARVSGATCNSFIETDELLSNNSDMDSGDADGGCSEDGTIISTDISNTSNRHISPSGFCPDAACTSVVVDVDSVDVNGTNPSDGLGGDSCDDICWVGATFDTFKDCSKFLREYAISRGYKLCALRKRCRKDGTFYHQDLVCSYFGVTRKQGDLGEKSSSFVPNEVGKRRRVDKKCECAASFMCKLVSGVWVVSRHLMKHSHPLVDSSQRYLLSSSKYVHKDMFQAVFDLMGSGIKPCEAIRVLSNEVGGLEALGMNKRMVYNKVAAKKSLTVNDGDAQLLLDTFKDRSKKDGGFFYEVSIDEEGHMCSFLWHDEIMKADYMTFGDVVVFDTTFRTNKYNMFCAPFIGIDNHLQNVVFAIAFLVGQKKEDFIWCFESFLRSMDGIKPKTIMTDQDAAIAHAVDVVLVGVQHRLCLWHICENARRKLSGLMKVEGFSGRFYKVLYHCATVDEFYQSWEKMISSYHCENNTWLCHLYNLRNKWSPALCKHIFSAGIRSSQRSESTNSVLTSLANRQMGIFAVFTAVEKMLHEWRYKRIDEDFRNVGIPNLQFPRYQLLVEASKVYTRAILEIFERNVKDGAFGQHHVIHEDGGSVHFEVSTGNCYRKFVVKYEPMSSSIWCSCLMFEERGYLCSHALRILNIFNISAVPTQYIVHRWTKAARLVHDVSGKFLCQDSFSCFAWRNSVMNRVLKVALDCQKDDKLRSMFEEFLSKMERSAGIASSGIQAADERCYPNVISSSTSDTVSNLQNPQFVSSNNFGKKRGKSDGGGKAGKERTSKK